MRKKNLFIETTINDWKDILKLNENFLEDFFFRGQANKEWPLSSSIERLVNRLYPHYKDSYLFPSQEQSMIKEFQFKSKLFNINHLDNNDYVEWLSVMQHYGSATRLVDFTKSIFVAKHMAVYESSTDSAVWCVNKHTLGLDIFNYYRKNVEDIQSCPYDKLIEYSLKLANDAITDSFKIEDKGILQIFPKSINERIYRQQGLFLMPKNIKISFMENIKVLLYIDQPQVVDFDKFIEYSSNSTQGEIGLLKINIPKEIHSNIIKNLRGMNINSEILFPGIEGLAKSLNYNLFNSFNPLIK